MKRLLIKGGRVLDPATGIDGIYDIVVMEGRIASIKPSIEQPAEGWQSMDCKGLLVIPGLVDLHTHLREPGEEYKETILTGTMAAAAGGVTTLLCMPNTKPVNDNASVTRYIKKKAMDEGKVNVHPVGAISMGLKGEDMAEMADLKEAGCIAVTDDGRPLLDSSLMRRALEYSKIFGIAVITHAEDESLSAGGVMNEGVIATRLGLKGMPKEAEDVMVSRDIMLAGLTGAKLHVAHVSTKGAVELIRNAKAKGINVTCEATPHHLTLTEDALSGYNTDFKMNPPLRTMDDVLALRQGLKDGTIDSIATDHAPHSSIEKDVEFDYASFGVVGLETSLSVILELVEQGVLTLEQAIKAMTVNPARAMGLDAGTIAVGSRADITIVDLGTRWEVLPEKFKSKGRNSPFKGMELKGKVVMTIVGGNVVHEAD